MTDERLKQIWSGFERETTRHLTGRGVENIHVPERREARSEFAAPERVAEPAAVAFEALKTRLAASSKKRGGRGPSDEEAGEATASAAAPISAARDLVRGLKSTEARTLRSDRLYGEGAGRSAKAGRRRKAFWLF